MTLRDTTIAGQAEAISFDLALPHRPEKVWRALTEPELLAQWLLPVQEFALERGAAFRFSAPPQPGWDGTVQCRIVDLEPPVRLSYRWVVGDLDTLVTFTLTPIPEGSRLVIVQSGFVEAQKRNWGGARYGWDLMGNRLIDLLGRTP
jgi:uncharacterized protein YndB with AHSA1/START domain